MHYTGRHMHLTVPGIVIPITQPHQLAKKRDINHYAQQQKTRTNTCTCDTSLPDELNYLYACFEANNTETCMRALAVTEDYVIKLSVANVSKTFRQVNIHKAAEPDVYCKHTLTN